MQSVRTLFVIMSQNELSKLTKSSPSAYFEDEDPEDCSADRYKPKVDVLLALTCLCYGLAILIISGKILRDEKLQIANYLGTSQFANASWSFPSDLLACCASTSAVSIVQMLGALMFLCQDISLHVWKWAKFLVVMVSLTCFVILSQKPDLSHVPHFPYYYYFILSNAIVSFGILVWDIVCSKCLRRA